MASEPITVEALLREAQAAGVARLDAQLLIGAVVQQPRSWLIAHDRDALPAEQVVAIRTLMQRRADGEPVAYLLGHKEFFGLTLGVNPDVLVPRPDTETLVNWALTLIPEHQPCQVLDLGTGSGAIALALAHARPRADLTAVDASAGALRTAASNGANLGLRVRWLHGSWFEPVAGERFDVVVSNPPYIAEGDPHLPALRHEPLSGLTAGPDGLDDIRLLVSQAPAHLHTGGWLLLEHGWDQAERVADLLRAAGFSNVSTHFDIGDHARCTGGQYTGQPPG